MMRLPEYYKHGTGKCFAVLFILIFFVFLPKADLLSQNISFKRLGLREGLSENAGLAINQDHFSRIWIGTRNGLNCWDGVNMRTFYPERGNNSSLMEHKITSIVVTGQHLWALSSKGVSRLDFKTMLFKRYAIDGIYCIAKSGEDVLAGTDHGLLAFSSDADNFLPTAERLGPATEISNIETDKDKNLWLVSNQNKKLYKLSGQKLETIPIPVEGNFLVYDMLADSKNRIWIGTRYHGIFVYDDLKKKFEAINMSSKPFYLKDLSVRSLVEDKEGRIWAGTFKGLAIFDLIKNASTFIQELANDAHSLSHNSIFNLFLSDEGSIWVGTYYGGVNYGRISNQVFQKYNEMASGKRPSHHVIGDLVEDGKGNIWIATEGAGIDYFNKKEQTFTNIPASNNGRGLSQTNIKSLYLATNNKLLIGTYQGGLNVLDIGSGNVRQFNVFNQFQPKHVNAIIKYKDEFLLGTEQGVLRFNLATGTFTPFFSHDNHHSLHRTVSTLYIDSNDVLWVSYENNGILACNLKQNTFKNYVYEELNLGSLPNNSVNCIKEDNRNRLWMGTDGGGLCLYNRTKDNFSTFNQAVNNLPSDFIYGIEESSFGNLWIATSKGLARFDVENNAFFNYTCNSGFPLQELNHDALLLTRDGELFVGGIDGLVSFKEKNSIAFDENIKVNLSRLFVNNTEVNPNNPILSEDIAVAKSFVLRPNHSVFRIDFTSFNYDNVLNNKYQYLLVGFDNHWINSEFNTSATYTNLNPGRYTFKVRATDIAYNPISPERTIDLTVIPPLTQTWYAYLFYALIIIIIVLIINRFYLGKMRLQYQLRSEREEKVKITELNMHKLRFFTNISHEFMTPLTIILSSLENTFSKFKIEPKLRKQLTVALRNAERLKKLNSELLHFRRIEQGHLKIRAREHNIVPYLQTIFEAFEEIARHKKIKYSFIKSTDLLPVYFDAVQMDKVFYNLLSNAFKHTDTNNGEVVIELLNNPDMVEIQVSNNGTGIPKDEVAKIFNRFFRHDSESDPETYQASSIGLALTQSIVNAHKGTISCESEEKNRTTFTVTLFKGNAHWGPEELSEQNNEHEYLFNTELVNDNPDTTDDSEGIAKMEMMVGDGPLVLVVAANPDLLYTIHSIFAGKYNMLTANDGVDGLEKTLEHQPDVIVSDVQMPKLSGLEMCKKLKANINTSHIPILLLTTLGEDEDQTLAFKYRADSYCAKPFNSEMLAARVESLLINRANVQQKYNVAPATNAKSVAQNIVDRNFMKKANLVIEKNLLNQGFSIDEFAAEMNLGRTVFYSRIKSITGQTPNDYIQTVRLNKAAEMLLNDPTKNISEVAYDSGFSSPRYFAMIFKKHFGVKPSQYLKGNKH